MFTKLALTTIAVLCIVACPLTFFVLKDGLAEIWGGEVTD